MPNFWSVVDSSGRSSSASTPGLSRKHRVRGTVGSLSSAAMSSRLTSASSSIAAASSAGVALLALNTMSGPVAPAAAAVFRSGTEPQSKPHPFLAKMRSIRGLVTALTAKCSRKATPAKAWLTRRAVSSMPISS
jgi:hypothetical protein